MNRQVSKLLVLIVSLFSSCRMNLVTSALINSCTVPNRRCNFNEIPLSKQHSRSVRKCLAADWRDASLCRGSWIAQSLYGYSPKCTYIRMCRLPYRSIKADRTLYQNASGHDSNGIELKTSFQRAQLHSRSVNSTKTSRTTDRRWSAKSNNGPGSHSASNQSPTCSENASPSLKSI